MKAIILFNYPEESSLLKEMRESTSVNQYYEIIRFEKPAEVVKHVKNFPGSICLLQADSQKELDTAGKIIKRIKKKTLNKTVFPIVQTNVSKSTLPESMNQLNDNNFMGLNADIKTFLSKVKKYLGVVIEHNKEEHLKEQYKGLPIEEELLAEVGELTVTLECGENKTECILEFFSENEADCCIIKSSLDVKVEDQVKIGILFHNLMCTL